jgi:hypothetical protein
MSATTFRECGRTRAPKTRDADEVNYKILLHRTIFLI